ncbi:MAG: sulfate permease [Rhodospirillales bacterium]|nr:sulfate permease [Rhodospirillales bacterium]
MRDASPASRPSFAEMFTPKLVTVLREGYDARALKDDAVAGLTVAIVAVPLCMAIAIASGLSPDRGLFTAIVGGFLISVFGGSRFQIGGPAGAFIVLVASVVERHGYDGLVLATLIAGIVMLAVGFLRLGTYIKYIPYPVTVGFTSGIAVIIFASQIRELLGLDIQGEPAALLPKLAAIWAALPTFRWQTMGIAALALATILLLRRFRPTWPGLLIAVALSALVALLLGLDVATIGTRFGGIPDRLPAPSLPEVSLAKVRAVLPDALAIAFLGSIESLLSALVADGMTGRRHRSNCELVAQGGANVAAVVFGGMPVTGTIARTATNVRAGARGPVSGILHALYILLFILFAAPLAAYVPLAALGAVLAIVSWNMAEREEFSALLRASPGDALVLLATFLLTVFEDLTTGIAVGVTLGAFLFLHRMAEAIEVDGGKPLVAKDEADGPAGARMPYPGASALDPDVVVYRISGAFFFGATASVIATLERIGRMPRAFILDFDNVPLVDATAAKSLERFAEKLIADGTIFVIAGARPAVRRNLLKAGLREPAIRYAATVDDARAIVAGTVR